jgi:hypothetical protein
MIAITASWKCRVQRYFNKSKAIKMRLIKLQLYIKIKKKLQKKKGPNWRPILKFKKKKISTKRN